MNEGSQKQRRIRIQFQRQATSTAESGSGLLAQSIVFVLCMYHTSIICQGTKYTHTGSSKLAFRVFVIKLNEACTRACACVHVGVSLCVWNPTGIFVLRTYLRLTRVGN